MSRLGVFSGQQVVSLLTHAEFVHLPTRGRHAVTQKPGEDGSSRTVPVPLHKEVKVGTLKSIIRQSGLPQELFMR